MTAAALEHVVTAQNLSAESENRIHSDDVAKEYGFSGALVGGVNVFAYMSHLPVAHYGPAWLERGYGSCRFFKPIYDGRETRCLGIVQEDESLQLIAKMADLDCTSGQAGLSSDAVAPDIDEIPRVQMPERDNRPIGSPESLKAGTVLGSYDWACGEMEAKDYLAGVGETHKFYADDGIVHPGMILGLANRVLSGNVFISPWMHVSSEIQNHGLVRVGERTTTRGRVLKEYEHKGHKFVELDVIIARERGDSVARIRHLAIYRPRGTG